MATNVGFVPARQVVLTAARLAQDPGGRVNGIPFYDAAVRDAVRELCFDTPWDDRASETAIPESRILKLPPMAGINNIFLFNGDQCTIEGCTTLYLKENYSHHSTVGFFGNQQGVNIDPLTQDTIWWPDGCLYYGGIVNDKLYLSPSCLNYSRIRVEYKGTGQEDACEPPPVPLWAVEAVQYFVAKRACELRLSEGNLFAGLVKLYSGQLGGYGSAWSKAGIRYRRMDKKEREDLNLYNSFFGPRSGW